MNNKYPTTKPSLNLDFANTKSLDPRITFRRGTPGTYYDGVTHVKAEENLIDYSEDFSKWDSVVRLELTANETAPDGSSTAYKIAQASGQTSSGATSELVNMNKGENYTYSIYAKAGTNRDYLTVRIYDYSISDHYQYFLFDLGNGQTLDNGIKRSDYYGGTHDIQDVGNGWYRCIVSFPVVNHSSSGFLISNFLLDTPASSTVAVADDGGFIYIWGAQLEQRDAVTSYTATNGAPITKYQPKLMTAAADTARFDHDPITGESKGLLIEEQRTNLLILSEDFSNANWVKKNTSITTDCAIAPDGTLTADKLIASSDSATHQMDLLLVSNSIGDKLTSSVYVKAGEYNYASIALAGNDFIGEVTALYDLSNGTLVATDNGDSATVESTSIEDAGNGWYRITVSSTAVDQVTGGIRIIVQDNDSINSSWAGDGYSGIYIWGAQLEAGSFPTSYIKTTGASATRSADNASITGENFSSWYRQDEGSFEIDASLLSSSATQTGRFITISDGSTDNRIQIDNNNTTLNFSIVTRSAIQGSYTWDRDTVLDYKFAFGLKKDDVAFCKNNESVAVDSSVELFAADRLDIKRENNFSEQLNGHIKKIAYYPQRLTNEQLQNLTK